MYNAPLVLGVGAKPTPAGSFVETQLSDLGNNTGNLLFSMSLFTKLSNATRSSYHFKNVDLEGRDCIIVAAANWLNPYSDFGNLAERLENTGLPVMISGLGAQSTLNGGIPKLTKGTQRMVSLLSDRSHSLSVRGAFTADVLSSYGVKNAHVTGCPSLLLAGRNGPTIRSDVSPDPSGFVLHSTRHLFNKCSPEQRRFYREAIRLDIDILLQSELADFYFALGRTNNPTINSKADALLSVIYGETPADVRSYLRRRGRVFFELAPWLKYASTKSFFFGTRFHGTIASLLAGTPAVLIVHDSRTLEMAEAMSIPYVLEKDVGQGGIDLAAPFERFDSAKLVREYSTYRDNFLSFFQNNGLSVDMDAQS